MANSDSGRKKSQSRLETSLRRRKKSQLTGSNISELRQSDEYGSKREEGPKTSTEKIPRDIHITYPDDKAEDNLKNIQEETNRQLLEEIRILRSKNAQLESKSCEIPEFTDEPQKSTSAKVITDWLILIGVVLGVFYWILESVIHAYIFHDRNFIDQLIRPGTNEIWMRLVVWIMLICFSTYAHFIYKHLCQLKEKLQQFNNKLEYGISERTAELMETNENLLVEISERKKAQEAVRRERDKAQKYLDVAGVMFVLIDKEGKVSLVNKKGCKILGYKESEIIGKNWFDVFVPEQNRERVKEVFYKLMAGEIEPVEYFENTVLTKDGEERLVAWHNTFLRNNLGFITGTLSSGLDITERRRAEEAMKKSSIIINSTTDAVITTDIAGNITFWNKGAEMIYGYQKEEAVGKPVSILYKDQDQHVLKAMIVALMEGQDVPNIELTCIDKNHQDIEILLSLTTIKDEDGNITELVGITKNITEHKQVEKKLRESEERYRRIIEDQTEFIVRWKPDGTRTFVNDSYCRYYGKSRDELIGTSFFPLVAEKDREKVKRRLDSLGPDNPVTSNEHQVLLPDGSIGWNLWTDRAIFDKEGRLIEFQSVGRDITERKKAEELIRKQNAFLNLTIESLPHPFCVIDANDYSVKVANSAARKGSICKGQVCYRLTHKQDKPCSGPDHLCPLKELKKTKKPVIVEHKHYNENHTPRFVEVHAYPALDEQGNLSRIIEYSLDITERKQAENKLYEYQSQLLSLVTQLTMAEEHQRREIAAELHDNASQEVAFALMKLENMREKADGDQLESLNDICGMMNKAVNNIRQMTFDICSPTLYKFGLETAIEELLEEKLGVRNKISYNLHDDNKVKPLSDDIKIVLFQSVRELVNNIIKHSQADNVTVDIRRCKENVRITVSDDGIGFKVDELESDEGAKKGFGLFSIAERIKYIGGRFEFQSEPNHGSSFTLETPLKAGPN